MLPNLVVFSKVFSSQYEILLSDTGIEYAGCDDDNYDTILVYDDFTDALFNKLSARQCCIIGPQVVIDAAKIEPVSLVITTACSYVVLVN